MGFDGVDKTDRFIIAARRRAEAALHETSPKLTALEKAIWLKLKRGKRPCKTANHLETAHLQPVNSAYHFLA